MVFIFGVILTVFGIIITLYFATQFLNHIENESIKRKSQNANQETKEIKKDQVIEIRNKWFVGYIIAGTIWVLAQTFKKTTLDELVILVIAIVAGLSYRNLKSKIKIKNETGRIILTFGILYIVTAFLIGFLTALLNR